MGEEYPWYHIVQRSEPLLQGDFISSCPIVIPPSTIEEGRTVQADVREYHVIVMSQSCDLVEKKIDLVLVCPTWLLKELGERSDFFRSTKGKEELRRGNVPGYHLLNRCEINGFRTEDYLAVDFRSVYGLPYQFIDSLAKKRERRLRLLPPYREHLSQAFARFFMRVGLPVDIPAFK